MIRKGPSAEQWRKKQQRSFITALKLFLDSRPILCCILKRVFAAIKIPQFATGNEIVPDKVQIMGPTNNRTQSFRGVLQSSDGVITKVFHSTGQFISFEAAFTLSEELQSRITGPERSIDLLTHQDDPFIFSERSRIARLGIQISGESPNLGKLDGNTLSLSMYQREYALYTYLCQVHRCRHQT